MQRLIKTSAERLAPLAATVQRLHSYETPEWISWVAEASPGYGQWLQESCFGDRA